MNPCRFSLVDVHLDAVPTSPHYTIGTPTKALDRFFKWLSENGVKSSKLIWPVEFGPTRVRGCLASEDISLQEVMVAVPYHLIITPMKALASPIGHIVQDNPKLFPEETREDLILLIYLLYESLQGLASFWHPYLSVVETADALSEWTEAELDELQNDELRDQAIKVRQSMHDIYTKFVLVLCDKYPHLLPMEGCTVERFKWAALMIQTRAFASRIPYTALVPFADSFNHGAVQTKFELSSDGNFFQMCTDGSSFKAGEEILFRYGQRDTAFLLLHYGFALQFNSYAEYIFKIALASHDGQEVVDFESKSQLLFYNNVDTAMRYTLKPLAFCSEPVVFFRAIAFVGEDSEDLSRPWTIEHERRSLQLYLQALKREEHRFKTTWEQDQALLNHPGIHYRFMFALYYRMEAKRLLRQQQFFIHLCLSAVERLQTSRSASLDVLFDSTSSSVPLGTNLSLEHCQSDAALRVYLDELSDMAVKVR